MGLRVSRKDVIALAEAGGAIAAARQGGGCRRKPDGSQVTDGDLATEAALREVIESRWPTHRILGEEGGETGAGTDGLWIVDPIDGTGNYAAGRDYWCVSVAFAAPVSEGWQVVLGAVHRPSTGDTWSAERGVGAWLRRSEQERPLQAADVPLQGASVGTNWAGATPRLDRVLWRLARARACCARVEARRAAALDLVRIASGEVHGFFQGQLKPWDFAAGALIVSESGARVAGLDGAPLDPTRSSFVAAGVPSVYALIR